MGRAHSNGYRQVAHFFDVDPKPRMVAICGRDEAGVKAAAEKLGWEGYETDYRKLVARDDVGLVDVSTIGNTHHEIVMAALANGKHVLCEKPLANTLGEAEEMLKAAEAASAKGIVTMINFNYRRVPAVAFARQLVAQGKIGQVRHWRAVYLQDWILDPEFPLVWRLRKELAGTGALGDIAAHITDLAHYVVGPIKEVVGTLDTFIKERPVEVASTGGAGLQAAASAERGPVTVDDSAGFLARFANGATGVFEVTRLAPGRRNYNSFEVNGSLGSIRFNLEKMNELEVYFVEDEAGLQGFRSINVTDAVHPYTANWWPAGHIIGYEHTFTHVVKDLLEGIKTGTNPAPTFRDGYNAQAVLDAVERSSQSRTWEAPKQV
jgi:predicted dehydrogenase